MFGASSSSISKLIEEKKADVSSFTFGAPSAGAPKRFQKTPVVRLFFVLLLMGQQVQVDGGKMRMKVNLLLMEVSALARQRRQ